MRSVRISENFVPVSEFKAQAADWLRKLSESGGPVVVTQNGRPAGVLLSPEARPEAPGVGVPCIAHRLDAPRACGSRGHR